MGIYLNPGNEGFQQTLNSEYVDKTGLIEFINKTIKTNYKLTCVSRPRRFGKTLAAKMLSAYYDISCDSRELFENLEIAKSTTFETHLNKYHVIYLDITHFISITKDICSILDEIQSSVIFELQMNFPDSIAKNENRLAKALADVCNNYKNISFIVIIDEWDALFREAKYNQKLQESYVQLLRGLFKGGISTDKTIAAAYITGILPIKKYGTESALTDFNEYTMVSPDMLASYVGFTEYEVQNLCATNQISFEEMKQWYDGYSFADVHSVYSPNSVMSAIRRKSFRSYWTRSETYESLVGYISMNLDGLKDAIVTMLGGQKIHIDTLSFQNDITSMKNRDDVLTLLIHLGYLAYDADESEDSGQVYIPNLEVAEAFKLAIRDTDWQEVSTALAESRKLLQATIDGNASFVSDILDEIHNTSCSVLQYHDENSLACTLTLAYYTAKNDYLIVREFPSGKGFADLAFIPRRNSEKPAMIVELKYDQSANGAIRQIKERRYGGELAKEYGKLLLIGINYDKKTKKHQCVIETFHSI